MSETIDVVCAPSRVSKEGLVFSLDDLMEIENSVLCQQMIERGGERL